MRNPATVSPLSRRVLLRGLVAGAGAVLAGPVAWAETAVKHYILIRLKPGADQLALDRWYMTYHAPQVRRAFQVWQRSYMSFRAYLPPEEAVEKYGVQYGRMTEIQFGSYADYKATRPNNIYGGLESYTPPPGGWRNNALFDTTSMTIPVNGDEVYVSNETQPKETPYLRWIVFFKYPEGVSAGESDAWWDTTHSRELASLDGLKRFVMYRSVREQSDYTHAAEFWFDGYKSWKAAFLDPAPEFTPPKWGGTFPFFETASMFVGENPDIDFIHDRRVTP